MYALDDQGNIRHPNDLERSACQPNDVRFGCTAYPGNSNLAYPFSTNPVTVEIEGTSVDNRYLRDVVPWEVAISAGSRGNKPLSTVKAQAIAARTFAYYYHEHPPAPPRRPFNNSTDYQVFVPRYYDRLTTAQRQRVDAAVKDVWYMSMFSDTKAIEALYGMDNRGVTSSTAGVPYLVSVQDPISEAYGCIVGVTPDGSFIYGTNADCGTGYGGMSSKGASRWGFGHTSSRGPVALNDRRYPHDVEDLGEFWSVRYDHAEQILTHYYTGIHIRDANALSPPLTPALRWNPLRIDWGTADNRPPVVPAGGGITIRVLVQNTGTQEWPLLNEYGLASQWCLSYLWSREGFGEELGGSRTCAQSDVPAGDPPYLYTVSLSPLPDWGPGSYTLKLDMVEQMQLPRIRGRGVAPDATSQWEEFWFHEGGWPTYDVTVCVDGPCQEFVPLAPQGVNY